MQTMILYFTGTGNSLYAAQKLADEGKEIVSLVEAQRSKAFYCTLQEGEKLGFVFPVCFYTVSNPVLAFVRKLKVENAGFLCLKCCGGINTLLCVIFGTTGCFVFLFWRAEFDLNETSAVSFLSPGTHRPGTCPEKRLPPTSRSIPAHRRRFRWSGSCTARRSKTGPAP